MAKRALPCLTVYQESRADLTPNLLAKFKKGIRLSKALAAQIGEEERLLKSFEDAMEKRRG